jgi:hypothetical protein
VSETGPSRHFSDARAMSALPLTATKSQTLGHIALRIIPKSTCEPREHRCALPP